MMHDHAARLRSLPDRRRSAGRPHHPRRSRLKGPENRRAQALNTTLTENRNPFECKGIAEFVHRGHIRGI